MVIFQYKRKLIFTHAMYKSYCAYFSHLHIYSPQYPLSGHYCYLDLTDEEIEVQRLIQYHRASWGHSWVLNPYILPRSVCPQPLHILLSVTGD